MVAKSRKLGGSKPKMRTNKKSSKNCFRVRLAGYRFEVREVAKKTILKWMLRTFEPG